MQVIEPFSIDYARDFAWYYVGMLWHALLSLPSVFGTTWASILVTILIFVLTLIFKMRRYGINAVKTHWKENIKDGMVVTLIVWSSLFVLNFTKTIYDNHRILLSSNKDLRAEIEKLQVDNQATVKERKTEPKERPQSQIIKVYTSPPDRRIPATRRDYIVKTLAKNPAKAYVGALSTDREAYELASDIWGVLRDARWNLPGGKIAELIGHMDPGITIRINGTTAIEPVMVFKSILSEIKLDANVVIDNEVIGDHLVIQVGTRPPS